MSRARADIFERKLVFDEIVGTLEGHHKLLARHIAHERLNTAIVATREILESEHVVLNALSEVGILLAKTLHHRLLNVRLDVVHDLGSRFHAAHTRRLQRRVR